MDTMVLDVQMRDKSKKVRELLVSNILPIEYYGRGIENKSFQVDYQTFRRLFRAAGTNTVVEMKPEGGEKINVLIHDVKCHPITDLMTHVDVIHVRMDEVIHTKVPVTLTGVAPAVKELAGVLVHHLDEIDIKCLPKDLIHEIEVGIESLVDFASALRVKDLKFPSTVEVLNDLEDLVATVVPPREEEPEATVEAVASPDESAKAVDPADSDEGAKKE